MYCYSVFIEDSCNCQIGHWQLVTSYARILVKFYGDLVAVWPCCALPSWCGGGAYALRTQRTCSLEVRSQLRADPIVRTPILHVTSAKWLVNFRLQCRLWLHSRLCFTAFGYIGVARWAELIQPQRWAGVITCLPRRWGGCPVQNMSRIPEFGSRNFRMKFVKRGGGKASVNND